MRKTLPALLALALVIAAGVSQEAPPVVETKPLSPADEAKQFILPPGFEAQIVASDPDVKKPMNLSFDDQGRLWVTDSVEYPFAAKANPRDTVKILEDFGPDGKARKITTFAKGLNIPIGLLPLTGKTPREALVFGIPNVYRLTDTAGKGVADARKVAFSGYGFADTHGMTSGFTPGFDGYVYACHGYANSSKVKGKDDNTVPMQSGNTYRFRPDGSKVSQYTWGQVNPFGLTIDPWGYLYSADCHSQPIYQLIRGAYYPSFGKPHDGLGFAPETITKYRGSTAISGIAHYAADNFPKEYQGNVFVGDVMTNQIVLFKLSHAGTSPKATQHVFLQSKDRWFRPVDMKLGPDGALYVADFYNCIIGHYEVDLYHPKRDRERGRIWRIVYTGKEHKGTAAPSSDFAAKNVKELVADLGHPNLTVRLFAQRQLVHRGKDVAKPVAAALKDEPAERRVHAAWVLEQLGALGDDALKACAEDKSLARAHAMRMLSERDKITDAQRKIIQTHLTDENAHVVRAAADALGRHPDAGNVVALSALVQKATPSEDKHLTHVARIALRNQLTLADSWKGADAWSEKDSRAVAGVALGVPTQASAAFLAKRLAKHPADDAERADASRHVARYGNKDDGKALVTWAKEAHKTDAAKAGAILRAIDQGAKQRGGALTQEARGWAIELTGALLEGNAIGPRALGAQLVGSLGLKEQEAKVLALAASAKQPDAVRVEAMNALAALDATKHAATLGKILTDDGSPAALRESAAVALGRANQAATRKQLTEALPLVPSRVQGRIAAALVVTRDGCGELLSAVEAGKASARLLTEREIGVRMNNSGLPGVREKVAKLTKGLPAADVKLAKLIDARKKGYASAKVDAAKGAKVFEKHCANCHQVAGKGAKVGPNLDGIGLRGLERLLEDVLDPNRNVDAAFRQTRITTEKAQVIEGLVLREEGEVIVLADREGKDVRIAKKDVDKREISPLSPMPANVGETIAEAEFQDLMAYLLSLRPGK